MTDTHEDGTGGVPRLEDVAQGYRELRGRLVEALEVEVGPRPWGPSPTARGERRSGCGQGEDPDGERLTLVRWSSAEPYDDAEWPRAEAVVVRVAHEAGFTRVEVVRDAPGDHEVVLTDRWGGQLVFGTAARSILALSTGCHPR